MALAVISTPRGIPVSQSPNGLPVTVSTNGFGLGVTPVASGGLPVTETGPGGLFDSGSDVAPNYRMVARAGSFVFTGEQMTVQAGFAMTAQVGAFALAGQSANLVPPAAAYTGPGEITGWDTAYGYWGLRGYTFAKVGTNCIDVCSNQFDTPVSPVTMKIGADGYLDLSNLPAYSPIYISKIYDQVGTQHLSAVFGQTNRPTLVLNKVGGKPAMFHASNDALLSSAVAVALAQPATAAAVVIITSPGTGNVMTGGASSFSAMFFGSSGALVYQNFGVYSQDYPSAGLNVVGSYITVADAAASSMSVNGTITVAAGNVGTNGIGTTNRLTMGGTDGVGGMINTGYIYEVIIKGGHVSTTNQGLLTANQRAIGTGF